MKKPDEPCSDATCVYREWNQERDTAFLLRLREYMHPKPECGDHDHSRGCRVHHERGLRRVLGEGAPMCADHQLGR